MYPNILHLSLCDCGAAASTLTPPTNPLASECVREAEKQREMECVYDTMRKGDGGGLLRNLREEENKRAKSAEEGDRYVRTEGLYLREGRMRHLEKRKSHWDEEEITAAQQWFIGENSPPPPPTSLPNPLTSHSVSNSGFWWLIALWNTHSKHLKLS